MIVNWTVRFKNKAFWVAFIPALLLLIQMIASAIGYEINLGDIGNKLLGIVNALFGLLAILGVVTDPTTDGLSDSNQAMMYVEPKKEGGTTND